MNERLERVLQKMEKKGIDQLLVSDPLSIRFLTGIMVHPGERLYALLLRTNGKHTMFLNYLYYVSDTGFEEVWFSDMDDQIGVLMEHIDTKSTLGIDKTWPARFLIPLQERCPEMKTIWGSDCVDGVRAVKNEEEIAIMKYIGAKDGFVRAPFIIEGILIGLVGAAIPLGILYVLYNRAITYILTKFSLLNNILDFLPVGQVYKTLLPVGLLLGIGIGFVGSFFTIRKHLKA